MTLRPLAVGPCVAIAAAIALLTGCTSSSKPQSGATVTTVANTGVPSQASVETAPTTVVAVSPETSPQTTPETLPPTPAETVPDTQAKSALDEDEVIELQIACVYIGESESCDTLVANGFPAEGNYGLGNSLSQGPDDAIAQDCADESRLACAEIASRYSPQPGDDALAEQFVNALIGDTSLGGLAADYLPAQMAQFLGTTEVTALEEANFSYFETGDFSFSLAPTTFWNCLIGQGLVRSCTFVAD